ncbi:MAG: flagellar basal-body rod protein FlgG [Paracoccaceae bacterium]|nr:flagellar basal-body rod protein FlgG [Paracoccaceae bacterium]
MRALQIAASGMSAQQTRVEVVSNNLANMSTTAYNARRAQFSDLAYQQVAQPGTITAADGTVLPTGIQLGLGVRPAAVSVMLSRGTLNQTGGNLDLAIEGKGYLEVTMPDGTSAYTRDGALQRSAAGEIVTADGNAVAPGITIPANATSVTINDSGQVYAYFSGQVQPRQIGQLTLASFTNEEGLKAIGSNLFRETTASGPPSTSTPGQDGLGTLKQGYLEGSSVDSVREVTELITAQRGYEMNAKVITAADQMLQATVQVR